jgi:cell wall-associated NlpC family hydrolase
MPRNRPPSQVVGSHVLWRRLICAALAACGAVGLGPVAATADPTPPPATRAGLAAAVAEAREQLEVVVEQFDATTVRMADTRARQATVLASLAPLRQRVASVQRGVDALATGLYTSGSTVAAGLFGAPDVGALLDQLTIVDYRLGQAHREVLALRGVETRYQAQADQLAGLASQEAGQQAALRARRDSIRIQIAALERMRAQLPSAWADPPPDVPAPVVATGPAGTAIRFALAQLGKGYRWAAAGPNAYDCSGLTLAAWRAAGVSLPHNAAMQWRVVTHLTRDQLRPGDLVFYYRDIHHVALYLGGGRMVHAPTYGLDVRIAPVDALPVFGYGRP